MQVLARARSFCSGDRSAIISLFHSADLSRSIWLEVAKHIVGLGSDEGGGASFPDAPKRAQLHLHAGVHFMAAAGGPESGTRLAPARAGSLLAAMHGLWRDFALNKTDGAKYHQLYWKIKQRKEGSSSVCGVFTCVAYISASARARKVF